MRLSWDSIRNEVIGRDATVLTPYGERYITYADYTASGRGLYVVETYLQHLLELYANTHTEDDSTGRLTSNRLSSAESLIKRHLNAAEGYDLIAVGPGATGAIHRLQQILGIYISPVTRERIQQELDGIAPGRDLGSICKGPVVFVGPYEHHSNEISWREGLATVVEVELGDDGAISLVDLEEKLTDPQWNGRPKIGSFSAASNVTGIRTDVYAVARLLHRYDAKAFFDFSASAPYVTIDMQYDDSAYFDAVFFSPHKFIGGPGASGLLVIRDDLYRRDLPPTVSGGGTVRFVSATEQDYVEDVQEREKAGTPGILQTIRAALALDLKAAMDIERIHQREEELLRRGYQRFSEIDEIEPIVPLDHNERLAIFSFNVRWRGGYLHPRFVVRLLNDLFGIQSRAGCSCAGPYGHRLLHIDPATSERYRHTIEVGEEGLKPGWVRLNFHYLMTDSEFEFVCDAIDFVGRYGVYFLPEYQFDLKSGAWTHRDDADEVEGIGIAEAVACSEALRDDDDGNVVDTTDGRSIDSTPVRRRYLDEALERAYQLAATFDDGGLHRTDPELIPFWYMERTR
jgi:selenocysteine lyase/cysteine desulfurase